MFVTVGAHAVRPDKIRLNHRGYLSAPTRPPPNTTSEILVIIKSLAVGFGGGAEGGGGLRS